MTDSHEGRAWLLRCDNPECGVNFYNEGCQACPACGIVPRYLSDSSQQYDGDEQSQGKP